MYDAVRIDYEGSIGGGAVGTRHATPPSGLDRLGQLRAPEQALLGVGEVTHRDTVLLLVQTTVRIVCQSIDKDVENDDLQNGNVTGFKKPEPGRGR